MQLFSVLIASYCFLRPHRLCFRNWRDFFLLFQRRKQGKLEENKISVFTSLIRIVCKRPDENTDSLQAVINREFKQITTVGATTAAVTEKVWGDSMVCQILAKRNTKMPET